MSRAERSAAEVAAAPRYMRIPEAAEYLATTPKALRRLVARGAVPYRNPTGGRVIFDRDELDRWIAAGRGVSVREALRRSACVPQKAGGAKGEP